MCERGSTIMVGATDAPLIPTQPKGPAHRATLGLGRLGSISGDGSGDIFIAFSTANSGAASSKNVADLKMLPNGSLDPVFAALVQATEEAIVNAIIAANSMTGINNHHLTSLSR